MTKAPPPARVTGIVAREAPVAVLFRRGPSRQVLQLLWNLKTDEITPGQWLKARVNEEQADLSPDGKHLLYTAGHHKPDPVTHGVYMAISKPPYFTALELFPIGHSWSGIGQFVDNRRFWALRNALKGLETSLGRAPGLREIPVPRGAKGRPEFDMMAHRGWTLIERLSSGTTWRNQVSEVIWCKDIAPGWRLERTHTSSLAARGPNSEVNWNAHALLGPQGDTPLNQGWAEGFGGDVLFAEQGRVYRQTPGDAPRLIADLNAHQFTNVRAPYAGVNARTADRNRPLKNRRWHPLNGENR